MNDHTNTMKLKFCRARLLPDVDSTRDDFPMNIIAQEADIKIF